MNQIVFNVIIIFAFIVLVAVFLLLPSTSSSSVNIPYLLGNIDALGEYALSLIRTPRDDFSGVFTCFDYSAMPNDITLNDVRQAAGYCDYIYTNLIEVARREINAGYHIVLQAEQYEVADVIEELEPDYLTVLVTDSSKFVAYSELGYTVKYNAGTGRHNGATKETIGENTCVAYVSDSYDISELVEIGYSNLELVFSGRSFINVNSISTLTPSSVTVRLDYVTWMGDVPIPGMKPGYNPVP